MQRRYHVMLKMGICCNQVIVYRACRRHGFGRNIRLGTSNTSMKNLENPYLQYIGVKKRVGLLKIVLKYAKNAIGSLN